MDSSAVSFAWTAKAQIAKDAGWHRRTVAKAVKYLVAGGGSSPLGGSTTSVTIHWALAGATPPALGSVPPRGPKFPITGGYHADGKWDEVYEYEVSGVFSDESDSLGQ
jgi:hypothetical protein